MSNPNHTPQEKEYLDTARTAKLVRGALKRAFLGTKFSVRSNVYSGGSSIDVTWTGGPGDTEVKKALRGYEGAAFDGMIDLKHYSTSWLLPDGSATAAQSYGTEGSHGSHPPYDYPKPHPDARLVHMGADFIFTSRSQSAEEIAAIVGKGECPQCHAPLIRNKSMTGWWQCACYPSPERREGKYQAWAPCSFQIFEK